MQIQISWLLQKPTDLDLHCLQRQDISGFSRTRVKKKLKKFRIGLLGLYCFETGSMMGILEKLIEVSQQEHRQAGHYTPVASNKVAHKLAPV